ncbi:MAG: hypothetical protein Aurels2KO_28990 [Aureliella sp.]
MYGTWQHVQADHWRRNFGFISKEIVSHFTLERKKHLNTRREKIEAMLKDEPNDEFLRYSLAMELNNDGEQAAALAQLDELTKQAKPYIAAYFRCGQILADAGRDTEARSYLRSGIEEAREQGDMHAAAEMSELLSDLGQGSDLGDDSL